MKRYNPLLLLLLTGTAGSACPVCNSATGRQVRASLLGPDLVFNLTVTIIPFAIFACITILIYTGSSFHSKKTNPV